MARTFDWRRLLAPMLFCGLLAVALPAAHALDNGAPDAQAAAVLGNWLTQPRDGIIQISVAADGAYQGRVIGGSNPHRLDQRNPDSARRQQELLGRIIMRDMQYQGSGRWSGGTIYDPSSGRTYKCLLELQDAHHLQVRGFLGISLLGRSQLWTRYLGSSMLLPKPSP